MKKFITIVGVLLVGLIFAPQSWSQTKNTAEKEVVTAEYAWKDAVVRRDATELQRLYADDYVSIDLDGAVWNKAEDIQIDTTGMFHLTWYQLDQLNVRVYGTTAIVMGRITSTGTVDGRTIMGRYRFTDVFIKRGDRWLVVSSQQTPSDGDE